MGKKEATIVKRGNQLLLSIPFRSCLLSEIIKGMFTRDT